MPQTDIHLTFLNISKKDRNPAPPTPAGRSLLWFAPDSTAGQVAKAWKSVQSAAVTASRSVTDRQFAIKLFIRSAKRCHTAVTAC